MKRRAYAIPCALLYMSALLATGATNAQPNPPPAFQLAKADMSSDLRACKAQCRKDYRRCYSQGNKVGTPYVSGGEPCSEQKTMCYRACVAKS